MDNTITEGPPADPHVVRALTNNLLQTYEEFLNTFDGEVTYVEATMAAHNFHVRVVEHLVQETGDDIWRNVALATFERRMKNPGAYDTKGGG